MPFWSNTTPAVVNHMGALDGQAAPPNSLEAVAASLEAGASVVEVDINALAGGDYLLVHDLDLVGETSGTGSVTSCTVEQARTLRIKHRGHVTTYAVPLLSDVITLFQASAGSARLQLDFKNVYPFLDDEPLVRLCHLIEPIADRVLVSSGADWQLRKLRKMAPWLMLGFDVMYYIDWEPAAAERDANDLPRTLGVYGYYDDHFLAAARTWPSTASYLRDRCESLLLAVPAVNVLYLRYTLIAQSLADGFNWAECCHAHGVQLDAWTMDVTNPSAVEAAPLLKQAGVDLFTTNTPRALAPLLDIS
ncbi:MAG: glycerophosphodiester phosphodiesterase family protein [Caldilineaceae bacterium]